MFNVYFSCGNASSCLKQTYSVFSDNNGSPEGPQKQLDLSTDFEFYMKVGWLVSPSVSRTTYKCFFYNRK